MQSSADPRTDWIRSQVESVADGVHRIPLPLPMDGLRAVNVYALTDTDGVTLIDSGWQVDPAREALATALDSLGAGPDDVRRCLITHAHRDHYTMAMELRRRSGANVGIGEGERPTIEALVENQQELAFSQGDRRLRLAGARQLIQELMVFRDQAPSATEYEYPDLWFKDGEEIQTAGRTLRAVHTPGHTSGHMVYVDADAGLLFAGDHVLPHITPSIGFEIVMGASPLADYLASLALVLGEPDRVLLPAHGPAGGSAHERVNELLEHHRVRLDHTLEAVVTEPCTAWTAAHRLTWTRRERRMGEMDLFNQMLATQETLSHLYVLQAQGRVTMQELLPDGESIPEQVFAPA